MRIFSIETGLFKLDGGAMFGVVPKTIWGKSYPSDALNLCPWAMRCMLIEEADRRILIDTGMGDKQSEKFFSYYYPDHSHNLFSSLAARGLSAEDITDVILTHLHFDHVGGAVRREESGLVPSFPNAKYWMSKEQFLHATVQPNPREQASFFAENFMPLQACGALHFLDLDNPPFPPSIRFELYNGHTKGMLVVLVEIGEKTVAYLADLIPSIGHLRPAYVPGYDIMPVVSMQEKTDFLARAFAYNYLLFFEHDPYYEACTLQKGPKGITYDKRGTLSALL